MIGLLYYVRGRLRGLLHCKQLSRLIVHETERNLIDFVERVIRVGVSSVKTKRNWKYTWKGTGKNQKLENYDRTEQFSYISNFDANNNFSGLIQRHSLTLNMFSCSDKSVDLPIWSLPMKTMKERQIIAKEGHDFPKDLHDFFKNYIPTASMKFSEPTDMSSDQIEKREKKLSPVSQK